MGEKTVEQSIEEFLEEFEKTMRVGWGLADSTIVGRMRCARRLVNFLDGHPLEADKTDILDFLEEYDAQGMYKGIRVIYGRFFDTELASDIKIPTFNSINNSISDKDKIRETFYNLEDLDYRTAYLMWASSGLRRGELLEMSMEDIDKEKRMLTPNHDTSTKRSFISFYNEEAERLFDELGHVPNKNPDSYTKEIQESK